MSFLRSFWRQKKVRQNNLTEIIFSVIGGEAAGLDKNFIKSVEQLAEGEYLVTFQEIAFQDIMPFFAHAITAGKIVAVTAISEQTVLVETVTTIAVSAVKASAVIQDLTFLADTAGAAGNAITISYVTGGVAGAEVVNVSGSDIEVEIEEGVSTATEIKAAIDGDAGAAALVDVSISGTAGNAQDLQAVTNLAGGKDALAIGDNANADFSMGVVWQYSQVVR